MESTLPTVAGWTRSVNQLRARQLVGSSGGGAMLGANMQNASLGPGNLKPLDLQLGHMLGKPSPSCSLGWLSTCSQWPLHIPPFSLQADCSAGGCFAVK